MPEQEATFHRHPQNITEVIYGRRLVIGDVIGTGDFYSSTNGRWEAATCLGVPMQGSSDLVVWIRKLPEPEGTIRARFE